MPIDFRLLGQGNEMIQSSVKELFGAIQQQQQAAQKARQQQIEQEKIQEQRRQADMQNQQAYAQMQSNEKIAGQGSAVQQRGQSMDFESQMRKIQQDRESSLMNNDYLMKSLGQQQANSDRSFGLDQQRLGLEQRELGMKEEDRARAYADQDKVREAGKEGLISLRDKYLELGQADKALAIDKAMREAESTGVDNLYKMTIAESMQASQGLTKAQTEEQMLKNIMTEDGLGSLRKGALISNELSKISQISDEGEREEAYEAAKGILKDVGAIDLGDLGYKEGMTILASQATQSNSIGSVLLGRKGDKSVNDKLAVGLYGNDPEQAAAARADALGLTGEARASYINRLGKPDYNSSKEVSKHFYNKEMPDIDQSKRQGDLAQQALDYLNANPGSVTPQNYWQVPGAKILEGLGFKTGDTLTHDAVYKSMTIKMGLNNRPTGSGSSSDKDVGFYMQTAPSNLNTEEGFRWIANATAMTSKIYSMYGVAKGRWLEDNNRPSDFTKKWEQYRAEFPMVNERGEVINSEAYSNPIIWDLWNKSPEERERLRKEKR